MPRYEYIFQIKYTEAVLSNSSRELLWFDIIKMLIPTLKNKSVVSFIIIFGALSFRIHADQSVAVVCRCGGVEQTGPVVVVGVGRGSAAAQLDMDLAGRRRRPPRRGPGPAAGPRRRVAVVPVSAAD